METNFNRLCEIDLKFQTADTELRKDPRKKIRRTVSISGLFIDDFSSELFDICEHGCRISYSSSGLVPGRFIKIRFAKDFEIAGIVRWTRKSRAGVEFTRQAGSHAVTALMAAH